MIRIQGKGAEGQAITAIVMDDGNNEGILGTNMGYIYYCDIKPEEEMCQLIKLVTRVSPGPDHISQVLVDPGNKQVFLTNSGQDSDDVKLYTSKEIDQIINWTSADLSPVRFVIGNSGSKNKRFRIIGHQDGELKLITIDNLQVFQTC